MRTRAALLSAVFTAAAFGRSPYDAAEAAMDERMAAEREAAVGNDDKRVWPYVIADRKLATVTVLACRTSIRPTDLVEFFLATVASGKDYEAMAVTFATPADVRAALDFIGLTPGRPIDPPNDRYWSGGPRVIMTLKSDAADPVRAESLVIDTATGRPLPAAGLIYTGSARSPADADSPRGVSRHVTDETPDGLIASVYNEPRAILDVPARAMQTAVYGRRKPSVAFAGEPGGPIDVVFAPAVGKDAVAVASMVVHVAVIEGKARFGIAVRPGPPAAADRPAAMVDLPTAVDAIAKAADGTKDLFTTVRSTDDVPVTALRRAYAVLDAVQQDRGVKLDGRDPQQRTLPHRAFFPDPEWRDRDTRLGEPWDLFLARNANGKLSARLERQSDRPDPAARTRTETTQPADPEAFAAHLKANASRWNRTLLVYPPADLTYGELLTWTTPVRDHAPNVYVFPPEGPAR